MPREEQVTAEERGVFGRVAHRDVEVAALLQLRLKSKSASISQRHSTHIEEAYDTRRATFESDDDLQDDLGVEVVLDHPARADSLPVQHAVQVVAATAELDVT